MQKSRTERETWAQFDALQMGMDWDENDIKLPQVLVHDALGDSHPGSVHLDALAKQVNIGVYQAGGKPAKPPHNPVRVDPGAVPPGAGEKRVQKYTLKNA